MTKEEIESCLDTIGVYRSVLSFMNVANKDSHEDRDMHIENLDKIEEMLRTEWKSKKAPTALDHIHNVVAENEYKRGYEQGKKDAAPKWIPVSERPPKKEGDYLVTDEAAGMTETMIDEYMCCDDGEWTWLYSQNAIAWMPLVEPYNGDSCPTIFKGDGDK